jgi:cysteine desulfurase
VLSVLQPLNDRTLHSHVSGDPRLVIRDLCSDSRTLYLDANATATPLPIVIEAVSVAMQSQLGNPASAHAGGASARKALESARDRVAEAVGLSEPEAVFFVSGGTEANNAVISSFVRNETPPIFLVAPVEHSSVIEPLLSWCPDRVSWLQVDTCGRIDPEDARHQAFRVNGSVVLLLQAVNSETGVIQPVDEIVKAVRSARPEAFVHIDAAQAIGRIRIDRQASFVDSISFSGHKIHGPQGTGVLIVRDPTTLRPAMVGGGQERGMRSGTPNVPGIVGLGVAARTRMRSFDEANGKMLELRDRFEEAVLRSLGELVRINGGNAARVSNTSNLQFRSIDGMQLLAHLDAAGVMASQGSACSSGRPEPSRVLRAMGLSESDAFSSLRFSFSVLNAAEDALAAADIITSVVRRLVQ